jgi:serine/threonine protein kinase
VPPHVVENMLKKHNLGEQKIHFTSNHATNKTNTNTFTCKYLLQFLPYILPHLEQNFFFIYNFKMELYNNFTPLCKGSYGQIFTAYSNSTGEKVALKRISKQTHLARIKSEIATGIELQNVKGVVKFRETFETANSHVSIPCVEILIGTSLTPHLF